MSSQRSKRVINVSGLLVSFTKYCFISPPHNADVDISVHNGTVIKPPLTRNGKISINLIIIAQGDCINPGEVVAPLSVYCFISKERHCL